MEEPLWQAHLQHLSGYCRDCWLPYGYQENWWCDRDLSDKDWSYHYAHSFNQNVSALTWDTTDSAVYLYIMTNPNYKGTLMAEGWSWNDVNVCVGEYCAIAGGGAALPWRMRVSRCSR